MATTASIYALTSEASARAETAAWSRFAAPKSRPEFHAGWLAILCAQIDMVTGGLLILGPDQDGTFTPAAIWPDASHNMQHLGGAAERVLGERRGILVAADGSSPPTREQPAQIGYPIEVNGVMRGAVVLEMAPSSDVALQRALRLVHWGSVWLVDQFRQQSVAERDRRITHLALSMDLVATVVQERQLSAAALAVVNEMSSRLSCDRVSLGFESSGTIVVEAISNTAIFDARMTLVQLISGAMDEALDLDATLIYPPPADDELGAIAHAELAHEVRDVAVCSVPLLEDGHAIGVLTLERSIGDEFDEPTIELAKTAGAMLGPILALKRDNERGTVQRLHQGAHEKAELLFGPHHPGAKLVALAIVAVLLFFTFANGTYRVSAKTVVEGAVQRAIAAPFDGHIAESFIRAGDVVRSGQVLVRLDDRELKLEHQRLSAERDQAVRKQRQALAAQDRGAMTIVAAQIAQSDAELALNDDKLSRFTLTAPFDGVVVSGDLNQLLGTPVEQGKLLFEIAPLDAYRVVLEVDERDIAAVAQGQHGEVALSGLPGRRLPFSVQQITPVASQQEGRNYFRVEAHLESESDRLRPGMEGVGKIEIGDRKLIWIWTHSMMDWLRTWAWKELP